MNGHYPTHSSADQIGVSSKGRAVLRLDDLPNQIDDLDLGGAPHVADLAFCSTGRESDKSMYFVLWPAHVNDKHKNVRISTEELSSLSGGTLGINSIKISRALQKFRALIERRANDMLTDDGGEIVLDVGSLTLAERRAF